MLDPILLNARLMKMIPVLCALVISCSLHAESKTCLKYGDQILPKFRNEKGMPTREWVIGQFCKSPELAKLEEENDRFIAEKIESVKWRTDLVAYLRASLNLVRGHKAHIRKWQSDLVTCHDAENDLIACSTVEIDIRLKLKDMIAEYRAVEGLRNTMSPKALADERVRNTGRLMASFKSVLDKWNRKYGVVR